MSEETIKDQASSVKAVEGKSEPKGYALEEEEKMFRALSACYDDYLKVNI